MKARLFGVFLVWGAAQTALAQAPLGIIQVGSPMKWGGTNAPDTYLDSSTFGPNPVLVNNGRVRIWQEQVATGTNGEWEIFHMQTVNGGPLANNLNANWDILMEYTLRVPASFDYSVNQWMRDGRPINPIASFLGLFVQLTNPILPGPAYVNKDFNNPRPAGVVPNWQQIFVQPYSEAIRGGIPTSTANEFVFALHFTLTPPANPVVTSVISAGAFGAYTSFAPGSWIEIYGTNFAVGTQQWAGGDFEGVFAPNKLGGTAVTIGGRQAFVSYVSPTQINVQVPNGVGTGPQSLVVGTPLGNSAPFSVTVEASKPGLLAPSSFRVGGVQNVVALFPDNVTYALPPGAIAGVPSRRARAGDTITFYGVGFGGVNPNTAPGTITPPQTNMLTSPLVVRIGGIEATVPYKGLAPNFVGLYQFNVVVPQVAASDSVPVTFTLNGVAGPQSLAIAVGN